jgi:hypothetical protein
MRRSNQKRGGVPALVLRACQPRVSLAGKVFDDIQDLIYNGEGFGIGQLVGWHATSDVQVVAHQAFIMVGEAQGQGKGLTQEEGISLNAVQREEARWGFETVIFRRKGFQEKDGLKVRLDVRPDEFLMIMPIRIIVGGTGGAQADVIGDGRQAKAAGAHLHGKALIGDLPPTGTPAQAVTQGGLTGASRSRKGEHAPSGEIDCGAGVQHLVAPGLIDQGQPFVRQKSLEPIRTDPIKRVSAYRPSIQVKLDGAQAGIVEPAGALIAPELGADPGKGVIPFFQQGSAIELGNDGIKLIVPGKGEQGARFQWRLIAPKNLLSS